MTALRAINREDGITVICNLHTLDTARTYCDRIIGMAHGRFVFDGPATALTAAALQVIYGADGGSVEVFAAAELPSRRMPSNRDECLIPAAQ
jgi:phosphonate transport system ATP-binding protein